MKPVSTFELPPPVPQPAQAERPARWESDCGIHWNDWRLGGDIGVGFQRLDVTGTLFIGPFWAYFGWNILPAIL